MNPRIVLRFLRASISLYHSGIQRVGKLQRRAGP